MLARLIYIVLLTYVVRLLFRALMEWTGMGAGADRSRARRVDGGSGKRALRKGKMVRDPVCGLNLPEDRAITAEFSGQRYHFCSSRCRESFRDVPA